MLSIWIILKCCHLVKDYSYHHAKPAMDNNNQNSKPAVNEN